MFSHNSLLMHQCTITLLPRGQKRQYGNTSSAFHFSRSKQGLRWKYSEKPQNKRLLCEISCFASMSFPVAFATSVVLDIFIICKSCGQMYSLQIQQTNVFSTHPLDKYIIQKSSEQMFSLQIHWTNVFFRNPVSHFKNASPTLQAETETGTQIYCEQLAVLSHIDSHKIRWVFQNITIISPTKINIPKIISITSPPKINFEQL